MPRAPNLSKHLVNNMFLFCFSCLNQKVPHRSIIISFFVSLQGFFSPHYLCLMCCLKTQVKSWQQKLTFVLPSRTRLTERRRAAFNHLFKRRDWNALEPNRCLHFVSVPGSSYAPARRYNTNILVECLFHPLRFRGQNRTTTNWCSRFPKPSTFFYPLSLSIYLAPQSFCWSWGFWSGGWNLGHMKY